MEGLSISACVSDVILVPEVGEYLFNAFATDAFFCCCCTAQMM